MLLDQEAVLKRKEELLAAIAEAKFPCLGAKSAMARRMLRTVVCHSLQSAWDDVRIHAHDRSAVRFIGGVSIAESGLSYGPLLDAPVLRKRILEAL